MKWRDWSNGPKLGSRIVILFEDRSGAGLYIVTTQGLFSADGDWDDGSCYQKDSRDKWAYLPAGTVLPCEVSEEITSYRTWMMDMGLCERPKVQAVQGDKK